MVNCGHSFAAIRTGSGLASGHRQCNVRGKKGPDTQMHSIALIVPGSKTLDSVIRSTVQSI